METVSIIGIDPSLRHTGVAMVTYNFETNKIKVSNCFVVNTPQKLKGLEAIKYALTTLEELSQNEVYKEAKQVVLESPPNVFNPKFPAINFIQCGHIVGGAACLFGLERATFCVPNSWNKRNKENAHKQFLARGGDWQSWHFLGKPYKYSMEHIIDAACIAWWYLQKEYLDD